MRTQPRGPEGHLSLAQPAHPGPSGRGAFGKASLLSWGKAEVMEAEKAASLIFLMRKLG